MNAREPIDFKNKDACWTVFAIDPVAGWLVAKARHRPAVTPNRLTAASAAIAVLSAVSFALGQLPAGAVLFQLAFVLDCMDGKLAHARGQLDPLGKMVDVAADGVRLASCAAGLALALSAAGALRVSGDSFAAALVCLYLGVRLATGAIAEARPRFVKSVEAQGRGLVPLEPSPWVILRQARRRSAAPGTTVDTEMVVFTLGPLLGLEIVALAVAVAVDLIHGGSYYARAKHRARRARISEDRSAVDAHANIAGDHESATVTRDDRPRS